MKRTILYIIVAYLSGGVLYANLFGELFGVRERYSESADRNPGTANAYTYGGFWCGTLTLIFELAKGALPVYLYVRSLPSLYGFGVALVMAAPVVGHILPILHGFHGGKGIAVTFGCLMGLFPYVRPLLTFAAAFVFLSVIVKVSPHIYRTIAAYLLSAVMLVVQRPAPCVLLGFLLICAAVCVKISRSDEKHDELEVKLLWMR